MTEIRKENMRKNAVKKDQGFSLIELLIVVAIILIIAAIAVPNLLKSKMAANEASAAASSRTVATSNVTYTSTYNIGYAGTLAQLGPTSGACAAVSSACADLVDSVLSAGTKSGYSFNYSAPAAAPSTTAPNNTFALLATPLTVGTTGHSTFCIDQTNVLKKDPTGTTAGPAAGGCLTFIGTSL